MADKDLAVQFLTSVFGPVTEQHVYVCSLANSDAKDREAGEKKVLTRTAETIAGHLGRWDRKDRGMYFCVGTISPDAPISIGGTQRCKVNIRESCMLHGEVDLKDVEIDSAEVVTRLRALPLPPSILVNSGNGIHAYWLLKESIAPDDHFEATLKLLADMIGGDSAVTDRCRLMRLPGSHNTKGGAWKPVTIIEADYERRYDLSDLEEMLGYMSPIIMRKAKPAPGQAQQNPFLAAADRLGFKVPIDVEARLRAMSYQGAGESSIHQTQLQVSASLLSRGVDPAEVVAMLLAATRAAAGAMGENWNWQREERALHRMCDEWLRKHPQERKTEHRANGTTGAPVADLAAAREQREERKREEQTAKRPKDQKSIAIVVADGVVDSVRLAGQDLLLTEGEVYVYEGGTWHIMTPADQQWLQTLIQEGFETLGEPLKTAALAATWKRLTEHPALFKRTVEWDKSGLTVTANGMLDPATRAFRPHAPIHYVRRKIGAPYDAAATCPRFLDFLEGLFANRLAPERAGFAGTIQTFFGASLAMAKLFREERKALLLVGPSRTGKTELAGIFGRLIGDPIATPSVAEISERFGLASLYDAAAWIRDDAINEGDDLDPQKFKTIVTGEPIDIERKHRDAVRGVRLAIPVLLTTNSLPRARDKSDAIFNRCLIVELTNEVSEAEAGKLRARLGVPRGHGLGAFIFQEESSGILNWALDGLAQLMTRGGYAVPDAIQAANQRFKDDNNPVGEWARLGIIKSKTSKVARADLLCAYHGWQREQEGEAAKALGARAFFPRMRAIVPWMEDLTDDQGRRYIGGVALTDEGLQLWERHNDDQLKGGSKGISTSRSDVNRAWVRRADGNAPRF